MYSITQTDARTYNLGYVMTCSCLLHPEYLHGFRFLTSYAAIIDLLFGCLLLVYQYIELESACILTVDWQQARARVCVVRMMIGGRLSV